MNDRVARGGATKAAPRGYAVVCTKCSVPCTESNVLCTPYPVLSTEYPLSRVPSPVSIPRDIRPCMARYTLSRSETQSPNPQSPNLQPPWERRAPSAEREATPDPYSRLAILASHRACDSAKFATIIHNVILTYQRSARIIRTVRWALWQLVARSVRLRRISFPCSAFSRTSSSARGAGSLKAARRAPCYASAAHDRSAAKCRPGRLWYAPGEHRAEGKWEIEREATFRIENQPDAPQPSTQKRVASGVAGDKTGSSRHGGESRVKAQESVESRNAQVARCSGRTVSRHRAQTEATTVAD